VRSRHKSLKSSNGKRKDRAGINKDLSVFEAATADDYIQIDFDGVVLNKQKTLERIKSSYAQLRSNEPEDMVVRIFGNTAIVTAKANPKGSCKEKNLAIHFAIPVYMQKFITVAGGVVSTDPRCSR